MEEARQTPPRNSNTLLVAMMGMMMFGMMCLGGIVLWLALRQPAAQPRPPFVDDFRSQVASSIGDPGDAAEIQNQYAALEDVLLRDADRRTPNGGPASVLVDTSIVSARVSSFLEASSSSDKRLSDKYPELNRVIQKRFADAGWTDNSKQVDLTKMAGVCHEIHTALETVSGVASGHLMRGPPQVAGIVGVFSFLFWGTGLIVKLIVLTVLFFALGGCLSGFKYTLKKFGILTVVVLAVALGFDSETCAQELKQDERGKFVVIDGVKRYMDWDSVEGPKRARELAAKTDRLYSTAVERLVSQTKDIKTVLLWRRFEELGVDPAAWNQLYLGSCVGFGSARATSNRLAVEIVDLGIPWQWVGHVSPDWTYAASRTITKTNNSGQGSTGAWAAQAITKWGLCFQRDYGAIDLTKYDPDRSLIWQKRGVPQLLIEASKPYPVVACHRVKSTTELKALINNGIPVYICSSVGFGQIRRDSYGFCTPSNIWHHCMMIDGYRTAGTGRAGFHVVNSWGDSGSGPVWPKDMPQGTWWISDQTAQRILSAGDSWAVAGVTGFKRLVIPRDEALDFGGLVISENESTLKPKKTTSVDRGEVYATAP
ncbi:MAG: hypothetical protein AAF497_00915 [Planctomycetota bacterium]